MRSTAVLFFLSCLGACPLSAQTPFQLVSAEAHRLATAETVVLPAKCDGEGNVYFRIQPAGPGLFDVVRISLEGAQKAIYRYSDVPELKGSLVDDFAIGADGKVYELVELGEGHVLVLEFSEKGEFEGKTELQGKPLFNPSQLVVLTGGNFFVSGSLIGDKAGHGVGNPFNAIFNTSGDLVRKFSLKKDADPKVSPNTADRSGNANLAVRFGRALLGDDGNLYVMRAASPALVYVISPAGNVMRTLRIMPPVKKAEPVALLTGSGRIAVEFSVPDAPDIADTTIRVADSRSGHTVMDYRITWQLGEAVACYSQDEFTFVGSGEDMWPSIMRAATH